MTRALPRAFPTRAFATRVFILRVYFALVSSALLPALFAAQAQAVLLEVDLESPGDAAVTRDTESGLDWLDLDQTVGLSVNNLIAGSGGWFSAGWRHATASEVCGVLAVVNFAPTPCPSFIALRVGEAHELPEGLFAYLGVTSTVLFPQGQAIALYDDETGQPAYGEMNAWVITDTSSHLRLVDDAGALGTRQFRTGHFLVRPSPIPEPSTALLVLAGLATLALKSTRTA